MTNVHVERISSSGDELFKNVRYENWPVVGFSPHVGSMGLFEMNLNTLYSRDWSLKEVFSITNRENGLCGFITLT